MSDVIAWYPNNTVFKYEIELYPTLEAADFIPYLVGYPLEFNGIPTPTAIMYTITGRELFISSEYPMPNVGRIVTVLYNTERDPRGPYFHTFRQPLNITRTIEAGESVKDAYGFERIAHDYHFFIPDVRIDSKKGFKR